MQLEANFGRDGLVGGGLSVSFWEHDQGFHRWFQRFVIKYVLDAQEDPFIHSTSFNHLAGYIIIINLT